MTDSYKIRIIENEKSGLGSKGDGIVSEDDEN